MLSSAKFLLFAACILLLVQSTLARPEWRTVYKSKGMDARLARIAAQMEEHKNNNETDKESNRSDDDGKGKSQKRGATIFMYKNGECKMDRAMPPLIRVIDQCFNVEQSLEIRHAARCVNGTNAMMARFQGKKCENAFADPLMEVDDEVTGKCLDTKDVGSVAFWCDGVPGIDLSQKHCSHGKGRKVGMGIGITFGVLAVFALIGGGITFFWNKGLGEKVMELFGRRSYRIRL